MKKLLLALAIITLSHPSFAQHFIENQAYREQMQKDFYGMAMNTNQLRILSQLVSNQPRLNLSGVASSATDGDALTKEIYNLSASYHRMLKSGRGDEPAVQEMKNRLNKLQNEYNHLVDSQGVVNDL